MAKPTRYHDQLKLQKRRHLMRRVLFISLACVVVCVALFYVLFFAKFFNVTDVKVSGTETVSGEAIVVGLNYSLAEKFLAIPKGSNMLFVRSDKLVERLLSDNPKLESVVITKDYFHKLNVVVKERRSVGIWCLTKENKCYYFDTDGVLYENAPDTSGYLLFNIKDERVRQLVLGEQVESQTWISALALARQQLTERDFQVRELVIPENSFDEFYALEGRNWRILMSINTDLEAQVKAMADFLKQKLTTDRISQLQYVDLRIQDRIYYK